MIKSKRWNLTVEVLEDLHTGSGMGDGAIDAALQRAPDGKPIIPASLLKGVLRASGEELVQYNQLSQDTLNTIFGCDAKQKGLVMITPLRVAEDASWSPLVWSSTSRELMGRTPKSDMLRQVEYLGAGAKFSGVIEVADDQYADVVERCLNRTTALGASRTRGAGQVRMSLSEVEKNNKKMPPRSGSQTLLRLRFKALDGLSLPTTGVPGNIISSECYVRGQVLRGAFAYWLQQQGCSARQVCFEGVSFGNAYPLPEQCSQKDLKQVRVIPATLDLYHEKPKAHNKNIPWWADNKNAKDGIRSMFKTGDDIEQVEKLKRVSDQGFICMDANGASGVFYTPMLAARLRNNTKTESLFSMEELAMGTEFVAELVFADTCAADEFVKVFEPVMRGQAWLGIGRGSRPVDVQNHVWLDHKEVAGVEQGEYLRLDSDLIVRDKYLNFHTELSSGLIADMTGQSLESCDQVEGAFSASVLAQGFNVVTGLPRAPMLAIRRGSVMKLSDKQAAMVAEHLKSTPMFGERTDEGFGRVALMPAPLQVTKHVSKAAAPPKNGYEELLKKFEKLPADLLKGAGPSRQQWYSFRQRALKCRDLQEVCEEFKQQGKKLGGKAWGDVKFDKLLEHVKELNAEEQKFVIDVLIRKVVSSLNTKREGAS